MDNFEVEFVLAIGFGDQRREVHRLETLPFLPVVGMDVLFPGEREAHTVAEVVWCVEESSCLCLLKGIPWTDPGRIAEGVAYYCARGWNLAER